MEEYYATGNLLNHDTSYHSYFSETCFFQTFQILSKGGTRMTTKKRKVPMYLFGSTIMGTRFPIYFEDGGFHPLPRPYGPFKPGNLGYTLSRKFWFMKFVEDIEGVTIYFLIYLYPNKKIANDILMKIQIAKTIIPHTCRISDSFFTHMTVLGNLGKKDCREIPVHTDKKDIITALVHFGSVTDGGFTMYYDGDDEENYGRLSNCISFKHGRIQIGVYNKVPHAASDWEGNRVTMNFNLKMDVLNHFLIHGNKYYHSYELSNFPDGQFCTY